MPIFKQVTTTVNGVQRTAWVPINNTTPLGNTYVELVGNLSQAEVQAIEDAITGDPTSPVASFLMRQGQVTTAGKTSDPQAGTYFQIEFNVTEVLGQGANARVESFQPEADPRDGFLVRDIDDSIPDAKFTFNRTLNGTDYVKLTQVPKLYGIKDGQSFLQLAFIHEMYHGMRKVDPSDRAAGALGFPGGHSGLDMVRHRTDGSLVLTPADLFSDDIEFAVYQEGLNRGLIVDQQAYVNGRLLSNQSDFNRGLQASGITTNQQLDNVLSKIERVARAQDQVIAVEAQLAEAQRNGVDLSDAQLNALLAPIKQELAAANAEQVAATTAMLQDPIASRAALTLRAPQNLAVREVPSSVDNALKYAKDFFVQYAPVIGKELGSTLGNLLASDESRGVQIASSTLLGTVGQNLGQAIQIAARGGEGISPPQ